MVKDVVLQNQSKLISNAAMKYMKDQQVGLDICFAVFNELFVEPFVSFVLNQSDKNLLLTKLLNQYKNRTEWFNRARLNELIAGDEGIYEHRLAADLYKYIFDRGMDLVMEPASPSGEVDFLASQKKSRHRLLIETKIFDGKNRHKHHVINGYKQCIHYAADYNEYAAYLVVFNVSGKSLSMPGGHSIHGFVNISRNNVIVYIMIIDIYIYLQSASIRALNEMIEFSIEEFR